MQDDQEDLQQFGEDLQQRQTALEELQAAAAPAADGDASEEPPANPALEVMLICAHALACHSNPMLQHVACMCTSLQAIKCLLHFRSHVPIHSKQSGAAYEKFVTFLFNRYHKGPARQYLL